MQQILHTMKHKKGLKGFMAMKIDFEKAYDLIRWSFVKDALTRWQLPPMLVEIIYRCISTCSMSVLWNGSPTDIF